ncbi:MAG: hypothetical protein KDD55_06805 [Bdellovibrionales bacterium]|nr:hypothetical protein [Bdellovibrionales bacterium]
MTNPLIRSLQKWCDMKNQKISSSKRLIVPFLTLAFLLFCSPAHAINFIVDENFNIEYSVTFDTIQLTFIQQNGGTGWMGVAFNEFPFPADTIVAWIDPQDETAICWDGYNPGIPTLPNFPFPIEDTNPFIRLLAAPPTYNQNNLTVVTSLRENGVTSITCKRKLITNDIFDFQFRPDMRISVYAAYNNREVYTLSGVQQPQSTNHKTGEWVLVE